MTLGGARPAREPGRLGSLYAVDILGPRRSSRRLQAVKGKITRPRTTGRSCRDTGTIPSSLPLTHPQHRTKPLLRLLPLPTPQTHDPHSSSSAQIMPSILARSGFNPLISFPPPPPPPPPAAGGASGPGAGAGGADAVAPGAPGGKNPGGGMPPGGGRKPGRARWDKSVSSPARSNARKLEASARCEASVRTHREEGRRRSLAEGACLHCATEYQRQPPRNRSDDRTKRTTRIRNAPAPPGGPPKLGCGGGGPPAPKRIGGGPPPGVPPPGPGGKPIGGGGPPIPIPGAGEPGRPPIGGPAKRTVRVRESRERRARRGGGRGKGGKQRTGRRGATARSDEREVAHGRGKTTRAHLEDTRLASAAVLVFPADLVDQRLCTVTAEVCGKERAGEPGALRGV